MSNSKNHRQAKVRQLIEAVRSALQGKVIYTFIAALLAVTFFVCTDPPTREQNLSAVISYYANQTFLEYKHAFIDLNNDGEEDVIVLLQGRSWCGSGGCTMLVLIGEDSGYRVISKSSVTSEPIRVSESISNGWRDIIVRSDGEEKLLQLDDYTYPANPSMESAATQEQVDSAKVVFQ